ncbi:MAG: FAD-dependent thymidylate synthase [Nitriliruptorales bacterium]|nr:FAD-dependent thymidylate synthase [Nitriliruptorales bacterium]
MSDAPSPPVADEWSDEERAVLERYFTNTDRHVFGLKNLPEVVKGALFARYSRSPKSIRRLFLDEFVDDLDALGVAASAAGAERAEELYDRIFSQYGDDSVAQLGGAHVAVEQVSNLMTKQLEWGRLAAYLEQSTRYIPYDDKPGGRYRYYRDPTIMAGPHADAYVETLDAIFDIYAELVPQMLTWVRDRFPQDEETSDFVYRNATKAKALDLLRGLLPAATTSNVGIFGSGQSYENLLLRLRSGELAEAQDVAGQLLTELRELIPSFLTRVDREDRGVVWSEYLATTREETRQLAADIVSGDVADAPLVQLSDWVPRDPEDAEVELATAILYSAAQHPEEQVRMKVRGLSRDERRRIIETYVGDRKNRRHKPGRGFERVWYRFDVLGDYGGFRDLQRHRMLTIEWQNLTTRHGYETPDELEDAGLAGRWHEALERSDELYRRLLPDHPLEAQYAVCFAYRVRYVMQMNARAAMQMLELRSTPQGHPQYRQVVQEMHRLIAEEAGHTAIADAMRFVDHGAAELERLESERAAEQRRRGSAGPD